MQSLSSRFRDKTGHYFRKVKTKHVMPILRLKYIWTICQLCFRIAVTARETECSIPQGLCVTDCWEQWSWFFTEPWNHSLCHMILEFSTWNTLSLFPYPLSFRKKNVGKCNSYRNLSKPIDIYIFPYFPCLPMGMFSWDRVEMSEAQRGHASCPSQGHSRSSIQWLASP